MAAFFVARSQGADSGPIGIWSLSDGKFVRPLLPSSAKEFAKELRRKGYVNVYSVPRLALVAIVESTKISLLTVPDGRVVATLPGAIALVGFSSDGRTTASIGPKGGIQLWSVPEGKLLSHLGDELDAASFKKLLPAHAYGAAISSDGRHVAYGDRKSIRIWSTGAEGKLVATLDAAAKNWQSMAFSPDGRILVTGGELQRCRLWSVHNGNLLATLSEETKSSEQTSRGAFSPDGRTLAVKDSAGVTLWLYT